MGILKRLLFVLLETTLVLVCLAYLFVVTVPALLICEILQGCRWVITGKSCSDICDGGFDKLLSVFVEIEINLNKKLLNNE